MRFLLPALLLFASCAAPTSSPIPIMDETRAGLVAPPHPAMSCVFCPDVYGKNDVKHLCAASAIAWDGMVNCICADPLGCEAICAAPGDWCSRLSDVNYVNASPACLTCVRDFCWPEVLACADAM